MEDGSFLRTNLKMTRNSREQTSNFWHPPNNLRTNTAIRFNLVQTLRTYPSCVQTIKQPLNGRGLGHVTIQICGPPYSWPIVNVNCGQHRSNWIHTSCEGRVLWCQSCFGISHTRRVVREWCKGDNASQWGNGKFDPLPRQNPLTDRHQKLHTWLDWPP